MKKLALFALVIVIASTLFALWLPATETTVRYGVESNYRPMIWQEGGTPRGISVDTLRVIESKTGIHFEPALVGDLPTLIAALEKGKIDMITSVTKTAEREKIMVFTKPYVTVRGLIYSLPTQVEPVKIIGVGKAFAMESYVREKFPAAEVKTYSDDTQVFLALLKGEITGAAMDEFAMAAIVAHPGVSIKMDRMATGFEYRLAFGFRRGLEHIVEKVSAAL